MSNREYVPPVPGEFIPLEEPNPAPMCPYLLHVGYLILSTGDLLDVYDNLPDGKMSINTLEGWQALVERLRQEAATKEGAPEGENEQVEESEQD